jgi:hypothetical protein
MYHVSGTNWNLIRLYEIGYCFSYYVGERDNFGVLFRIPEGMNPSEDVGINRRIVLKRIVGSEDLE